MKVKVRKKNRIGAYTYDLIYVEGLERDFNLLGQCNSSRLVIRIEPTSPSAVKDVSLFHEVLHGIDDTSGCGLDEVNIDRLAQGIAHWLKETMGLEFDWSEIK